MSRILFGQSYYLHFDPKLYAAMQPYPPLGTLYAAAYLRSHGYDVSLFDAMLARSEEEWSKMLERHTPKYAILYEDSFNYLSKMCLSRMRDAAHCMIDLAKSKDRTVILCGSDATDHAGEYLKRGADYVILGEGEETLLELIRLLENGGQGGLENIPGLAWLGPEGKVQCSPRRPDMVDLDRLPFPSWDLVDIARYRALWHSRHGYYSMNMVTTRGCPFHCNWCAKPIWGQRYNSRSPENVVDELEWLKNTFAPQHIWFADDVFGLKPGWIERFGELAAERAAAIPFKCQMRADLINLTVVEALKKARCETVWLGAESGSQKILDAMEKGVKVEQIYQARQMLGGARIRAALFLQFGYPGETRADIEKTIQMVRDLMPDDIGISVSYPLPGTPFYERVKSQLGGKRNWVDSDDLAMLFRGPFPEPFYRTLHRTVHAEFRMRKNLRSLASREDWANNGVFRQVRRLADIARYCTEWKVHTHRLDRFYEIREPMDAPLELQ